MTTDINGQELQKGGLAMLLCEILEVEPDMVRLRIMNSDMELAVGVRFDEVLGRVADTELTAFLEEPPPAPAPPDTDQVRSQFE